MTKAGDGRRLRRRRWAPASAVLAVGLVALSCADRPEPARTDGGPSRPEPVGTALDLSEPGFHRLPAPPIEPRHVGDAVTVVMEGRW